MKADDVYVQKASDLLDSIFTDIFSKAPQGGADLERGWKNILQKISGGEKLAAHSRITDLKNNLLHIETDHPGWIQLFNMHQKRILKELKKEFPELSVKGFSFVLRGKEKKTESGLRDLTVEETEKWLNARDSRSR